MVRSVFCALFVALLSTIPVLARGDEPAPAAAEKNRLAASLGVSSWSDLADLQPDLGGDFDEWGLGFNASAHHRIGMLGPVGISLGAGIGILSHGSDVEGVEEGNDLVASVVYVLPSVQLDVGNDSRFRFFVDAGYGYYATSIDEFEDSCFWCDSTEYYSDSSTGGYVGLGADFDIGDRGDIRITAAAKSHFVDFDAPVELDAVGSLDGPIYEFQVGIVVGL